MMSVRDQVGVQSVPALLFLLAALFFLSGTSALIYQMLWLRLIGQFVGDGPILTDDKPLVEYFLSLPRDRDVNLSGVRGDVTRYVVQP